ncbi:hypothetical protein [Ekhidna sp.]|uniref:hypothetical protein n=1 Tax=Ekhidna sp. TaxID=2608089 RepID=UPI003513974D
MANDQLSGVCPAACKSTKVVKSAEAHNGSKWHLRSESQNLLRAEDGRKHYRISAADITVELH